MIRNAADTNRLAEVGDAFVDVDRSAERWVIGNGDVTCAVRVGRNRTVTFEGLSIAGADGSVGMTEGVGALITIDGETLRLGAAASAFGVDGVDASAGADFVALAVRFTARDSRVIATRRFVARPHGGAIEVWTDFQLSNGEPVTIADLNAFALTVPAGTLDWVEGLEPLDGTPSFTKRSRPLGGGERIELGSPVLSSLRDVPFFSIGNGQRRFFAGLAWSGGWSASLHRQGDVTVVAGLTEMSAVVSEGQKVEGPHAVLGVVADRAGAEVSAITRFVFASRSGREFPALTTFNTWFLHGTQLSEDIIRADIDAASAIGIELLQIDAGWYPGSRADAPFDFTNGLGSWIVDAARFPSGLGPMREHAHHRGMRLGVWVEPERVALSEVGQRGLSERFLAQQDGRYDPALPNAEARDAMICLADAGAREWVLARLTELVDQSGADNLKWDLNRWVSCTREGHGHPVNGGNFAHTCALYEILETLRARYPALIIENCAGGARRADFAMARLTDTAWMDDRTAPALHVRYNLDGLLSAFPTRYLFSYVMSHASEVIMGHEDIPMLVRSRMPGVVGLTADIGALREREVNQLHQEIELAKRLRDSLGRTVTFTLTPQTQDVAEWHVVQQVSETSGTSAIFAYAHGLDTSVLVMPRQIRRDLNYELRSADRGRLGVYRGADLADDGLEIRAAPESAVQVLMLEPLAASARAKK